MPQLQIFKKTMTIQQVKFKVFKMLRPLLKIIKLQANIKGQTISQTQYNQMEFNYLFVNPNTGLYNRENEYYDLCIFNNLPVDPSTNTVSKCEFCNNVHTDHCLFDFGIQNDSLSIQDLQDRI